MGERAACLIAFFKQLNLIRLGYFERHDDTRVWSLVEDENRARDRSETRPCFFASRSATRLAFGQRLTIAHSLKPDRVSHILVLYYNWHS
jgi:hypothetical protein